MAYLIQGQDTSHSSFSTLRTPGNKMRALCYLQSSSNLAIDLLASSMFSMAFIPLAATVNINPASVHLLNASRTCSRSQKITHLIIDAIDECLNTTGLPLSRDQIMALLERLVTSKLPNLRICVTSRPEADIRTFFEPLTSTFNTIFLYDTSGQKMAIINFVTCMVRSDRKAGSGQRTGYQYAFRKG